MSWYCDGSANSLCSQYYSLHMAMMNFPSTVLFLGWYSRFFYVGVVVVLFLQLNTRWFRRVVKTLYLMDIIGQMLYEIEVHVSSEPEKWIFFYFPVKHWNPSSLLFKSFVNCDRNLTTRQIHIWHLFVNFLTDKMFISTNCTEINVGYSI